MQGVLLFFFFFRFFSFFGYYYGNPQLKAPAFDLTLLPDGQELKLGFLTFPSFYADFKTGENLVSDHVEVLLRRLVKEGMDGLVLDLRNNGGGSLQEVKRMTAFFTGGGPVVQIRDTRGRTKVLTDDGDAVPDQSCVDGIAKEPAAQRKTRSRRRRSYLPALR